MCLRALAKIIHFKPFKRYKIYDCNNKDLVQHVSKPTITIVLPILLKSSVDIWGGVLVWIGRGPCSVHRPAVCSSLFAVWWFGDEFEMSHWLPVRAEQLWVGSGLPQA